MSLSRFFKNSPSFQPKSLVDSPAKENDGWQEITCVKSTAKPFSPEQQIKEKIESSKGPSAPEQFFHNPSDAPDIGNKQQIDPQTVPDTSQPPELQLDPQDVTDNNMVPEIPEGYIPEADVIKREQDAYNKGKLEGITEGSILAREKQKNDFDSAAKAMHSICTQLETCRDTLINNSSKELQEFAIAIAEQIIRYSVKHHDQTIVATIEEALQRSIKSTEFYIFINPEDYETVEANAEHIIAGVNGLQNIILKKDPKIERGGARIESENCTIDATITSQFETIRQEIEKKLL